MTKFLMFVGVTAGGALFGWLGDLMGMDFFWSFAFSGVGSMVGVWVAWKLDQRLR